MFENFLTNLKNQTNNLTDTFRSKSRRLALNINSFKEKIISKPKTTYYYTISRKEECDYHNNDDLYLSPRAYYPNDNSWPSITENMQWVPYVPPKLDEQNIVDRFIKVITIDHESNDNVRQAFVSFLIVYNTPLFCRGGLIEKKFEGVWPWARKMIIMAGTTGLDGSQVCSPDCRVVSYESLVITDVY